MKNPKDPNNEKMIVNKIIELTKSDPSLTQALADDLFANDPMLSKANLSESDRSTVVKFVLNHPGMMSEKQPSEEELNNWLKEDDKAKAIYDKVKATLGPKSHLFSHLASNVASYSHNQLINDIKKKLYQDAEIKALVDAGKVGTPEFEALADRKISDLVKNDSALQKRFADDFGKMPLGQFLSEDERNKIISWMANNPDAMTSGDPMAAFAKDNSDLGAKIQQWLKDNAQSQQWMRAAAWSRKITISVYIY